MAPALGPYVTSACPFTPLLPRQGRRHPPLAARVGRDVDGQVLSPSGRARSPAGAGFPGASRHVGTVGSAPLPAPSRRQP